MRNRLIVAGSAHEAENNIFKSKEEYIFTKLSKGESIL